MNISTLTGKHHQPTIPRDWRDNLATAINERDLARIETLIEYGATHHNHNKFNDPLIADGVFLLQMAKENSLNRSQMMARTRAAATAFTNSRLATDKKGGSMSWVAPPIASFVAGPSINSSQMLNNTNKNNSNNPLGNTQSLRDRVSQLREMALFPDSTAQQMMMLTNNNGDMDSFVHHNYSSPAQSRLVSQHQMILKRSGGGSSAGSGYLMNSTTSQNNTNTRNPIVDDAAAAMGVPSAWIERPIGINWEFSTTSQQQREQQQEQRPSPSPKRRSFYPSPASSESHHHQSSSSPIRSVFQDSSLVGAALRLHSFVHAEEEPPVKSSRLYQAYASMERMMPRNNNGDHKNKNNSPPSGTVNTNTDNNNNNNNSMGVEISVSPEREEEGGKPNTTTTTSSSSLFPSDNLPWKEQQQESPEQKARFVRKMNNEAVAPQGIELTRMLRFLAATEMMNRGTLEQEAQSEIHSSVANYRFGVMHARGISTDRGTTQHRVFLDN